MLILWLYLFAALFPSALTLPTPSMTPGSTLSIEERASPLELDTIAARNLPRYILPRTQDDAAIPTILDVRAESPAAGA